MRAEPCGERFKRGRPLSDLFGKSQRQFACDGSRLRCLPEQGGETLRLEEIVESGRSPGRNAGNRAT